MACLAHMGLTRRQMAVEMCEELMILRQDQPFAVEVQKFVDLPPGQLREVVQQAVRHLLQAALASDCQKQKTNYPAILCSMTEDMLELEAPGSYIKRLQKLLQLCSCSAFKANAAKRAIKAKGNFKAKGKAKARAKGKAKTKSISPVAMAKSKSAAKQK